MDYLEWLMYAASRKELRQVVQDGLEVLKRSHDKNEFQLFSYIENAYELVASDMGDSEQCLYVIYLTMCVCPSFVSHVYRKGVSEERVARFTRVAQSIFQHFLAGHVVEDVIPDHSNQLFHDPLLQGKYANFRHVVNELRVIYLTLI